MSAKCPKCEEFPGTGWRSCLSCAKYRITVSHGIVGEQQSEIARLREAVRVRDVPIRSLGFGNVCRHCSASNEGHADDCPTVTHPLEAK
jgi:hypothetical protein